MHRYCKNTYILSTYMSIYKYVGVIIMYQLKAWLSQSK